MSDEGKLLLKKYPNRRLYDTEKSTYITLNQVFEAIKQGREVKVIDAKTEENVTASILSQIIMEEARKQNALLPVSLLHLIIRYGENVLNEFFKEYLEATIRSYLAYKKAFDDQFRNWLNIGGVDFTSPGAPPPYPFGSFDALFDLFSPPGSKKKEQEKKEDS